MTAVTHTTEGYVVDAALLGRAFALDPATVQELMRTGKLAGHHEKGMGADDGRHCLSFSYEGRTFRMVLDSQGNILSQSMFKTIVSRVQATDTPRPSR